MSAQVPLILQRPSEESNDIPQSLTSITDQRSTDEKKLNTWRDKAQYCSTTWCLIPYHLLIDLWLKVDRWGVDSASLSRIPGDTSRRIQYGFSEMKRVDLEIRYEY